MRKLARVLGVGALLALLAVGCASTPAGAPATGGVTSGAIAIKGFAFAPAQLSVNKGATVTWTNEDGTTHTVTSGVPGSLSGKFDQRVEASGKFTFTFTDAGTYEFFCNIHNTMRGTVLVK